MPMGQNTPRQSARTFAQAERADVTADQLLTWTEVADIFDVPEHTARRWFGRTIRSRDFPTAGDHRLTRSELAWELARGGHPDAASFRADRLTRDIHFLVDSVAGLASTYRDLLDQFSPEVLARLLHAGDAQDSAEKELAFGPVLAQESARQRCPRVLNVLRCVGDVMAAYGCLPQEAGG